jgi:hypothetical protein
MFGCSWVWPGAGVGGRGAGGRGAGGRGAINWARTDPRAICSAEMLSSASVRVHVPQRWKIIGTKGLAAEFSITMAEPGVSWTVCDNNCDS